MTFMEDNDKISDKFKIYYLITTILLIDYTF